MYNFFAGIGNTTFTMFGSIHIALIVNLVVLAVLMYIYRDKLRDIKHQQTIRYVLGTILLINMIIYYLGMYFTGVLSLKNNAPIHICFLTNFAISYILFTDNKKFYSYIYYLTFLGPLPAIIWTNLHYTFDTYVFYQFIISHHFMLLVSLYILLVLNYKVEKKDMLKSISIILIYLLLINILNNLMGTNYLMINSLPIEVLNEYPFLTNIPAIIPLVIAALCALYIAYVPVYFVNKEK